MTSARLASDRTLRGLAATLWWIFAATIAAAIPLALAQESTSTWGASGLAGEVLYAVLAVAFPLVGHLILRRQPQNTIGWVLLLHGGVAALSTAADSYATYGLLVAPGSLPAPEIVAALNEGSWAPWIGLPGTFLVLLYPDGHLPSLRWRPVAWASAVTIVVVTTAITFMPGTLDEGPLPGMTNPLGFQATRPVFMVLITVFLPLLPICIVASAAALVLRFRRSHGIERLQLKWLATAGAVVAFLYLLTMVAVSLAELTFLVDERAGWLTALQTVSFLSFLLLPLSIGVAILRHRLYDIDLVINRALVYGTLTATLGGVYLGSVLLLQLLLNPLTAQSDLAVAGSTLAVAALFGPARARIQASVDRRFYRSRYDAARTLDAFATRLRSELDLDAVGTDLRTAVTDTVQPTHISLWIRP